ncbi:MAG: tetratricopeptide repeat protein [Elusimicrobiales bacterium]
MKIGFPAAMIAALLATAAVLFMPAVSADFTNWDDDVYITNNPLVRDFSAENVKLAFSSAHKGLYKPLTLLSFAAEHKLFGLNPAAYHADNLILHLCNCLLAGRLAFLLAGTEAAFAAALLFGVHPMHVESVLWLAERKDLLYTMFFLLSVLAYMEYRRAGSRLCHAASAAALALSMMSKPQGFMLPAALVLVDWLQGRRFTLKDKIPHIILAGGFLAAALFSVNKADALFRRPGFTVFDNFCVGCYGLLCYVRRFFLPFDLAAVYPYPQKAGGWLPPVFVAAPLAAAAVAAGALWLWRANRRVIFGILFFLAALLPGLQFLPVSPSVAFDHYSYLAYFGLFFAAAELLAHSPKGRAVLLAAALALAFAARERAFAWQNSLTLWNDELSKYPGEPIALNNRALAYLRLGETKAALSDAGAAIAAEPGEGRNLLTRGLIHETAGSPGKAMADYNRALEINPNLPEGYISRGNLLRDGGDLRAAFADYARAARLSPEPDGAYNNMGNCAFKLGQRDKALEFYGAALKLNPNYADAWFNKGQICLARGELQCAEHGFSRALRLEPLNSGALALRAQARLRSGDFRAALGDYEAASASGGGNADIFSGMGAARLRLGDAEGAVAAFSRAAELEPRSAAAHYNRGQAFLAKGDCAAALADYSRAVKLDPHYDKAVSAREQARKNPACAGQPAAKAERAIRSSVIREQVR